MDPLDRHNARLTQFLAAALFAATLVAFWPVTRCDFVNFDDPEYVTENVWVGKGLTWDGLRWAFSTGHAGNWHPLTWLSHMVDVQVFGLQPAGHHLVNLLFHGLNTVLLFLALRRLTGAVWRCALVAALFGLHPLHVESVAWISERKDVLSTCFLMLALWAYGTYAGTLNSPQAFTNRRTVRGCAYGLALLSFALGLLSKAMLVTLPFVLLLLDYWPLGRWAGAVEANKGAVGRRLNWLVPRRLLLEKLPFFALALAASVVTFYVQKAQGAVSSFGGLPWQCRLANAIVSYVRYVEKMFWPAGLAAYYPHPDTVYPISTQWPAWAVAAAALGLVMVSAGALWQLPRRPWLAVGWFWYVGTLVPVIGLVQVGGQAMADRYTYIPLIGLFILLAWSLPIAHEESPAAVPSPRRRCALGLVCVGILLACGLVSWRQVQFWQNSNLLFQHALEVTSNNPTAHFNLGAALEKQGHLDQALEHYRATVALDPSYADAHFNLGNALSAQKKPAEAIAEYELALRLRPNYADAYNNLGTVLLALGKTEEAASRFSEAIRLNPNYAIAHENWASVLRARGEFSEAAEHYTAALRLDPDSVQARVGLALVLAQRGQGEAAVVQWREAIQRQPGNAEFHRQLAFLLGRLGQLSEAGAQFEEVARLRPDAQAQYELGLARAGAGRNSEAIACFRAALELKPDWPEALNDLAWALATHPLSDPNQALEAVGLARRACELSGGQEARFWGTLDAAYAQAGRFDDALTTAQKALALALKANQSVVADAARKRLELYRQRKPFQQP